MNAKPSRLNEIVVIALAVPLLGILLGGVYSYPAMRLTKERDPWLTLLLGVGLTITVFGIGCAAHTPLLYIVSAWFASLLLLVLARAAFGNLGHNFERFGMVHIATLLIMFWVLFFTRHTKPTSPNNKLSRSMLTPIEQALFQNGAAHCVANFELAGEAIAVVLHPWERPELQTRARFEGVKVLSIDDSYADADAGLPWDIIGFDSEPLTANRWRYCLHTDAIEYCFEAGWPAVEGAG